MPHKVYLSHRNIATLLSKLDGKKNGQATACTIIKNDDEHPTHPQTFRNIAVTAVEDNQLAEPSPYSPRLVIARCDLLALLAQIDTGVGARSLKKQEGTDEVIEVFGVDDVVYYRGRQPGPVHPLNDPGITRH